MKQGSKDLTASIQVINIKPKTVICKCCQKTFTIEPYIEQPLCNKCYTTAVKMLFSGMYDDLTAVEFRNAVKKGVLEAGNETRN